MATNHFSHAAQPHVFIGVLPGGQGDHVFNDLSHREWLAEFEQYAARRHVHSLSLNKTEAMAAANNFEGEAQFKALILTVFVHGSP